VPLLVPINRRDAWLHHRKLDTLRIFPDDRPAAIFITHALSILASHQARSIRLSNGFIAMSVV
jgi:hypothetical protein